MINQLTQQLTELKYIWGPETGEYSIEANVVFQVGWENITYKKF